MYKNSSIKNLKISLSWTFEELESCGWVWSADNEKLTFSNSLQISNKPHLINTQGLIIEIGTKIEEIPLFCDFARELTLESNFEATQSLIGQDGTTLGGNDFSAVFNINLNEYDENTKSYYKTDGVTVGEPLQVNYFSLGIFKLQFQNCFLNFSGRH